ncbi:MAG: cytochrome c biogenesis protein CcdA [Kiritimatiellia bacterium]
MIPKFLRSVEKSPKVFTCYVKIRKNFYVVRKTTLALAGLAVFLPLAAAAASPFAVSAARETFADQSAVRVAFDFPADHHLYASFAVADPAGTALVPLSVPAPDTDTPDDPLGPSYSTSFAAVYAAPAAESVVVSYQGCAGAVCFMPEEVTLSIGAGPANAIATASASAAPAAAAFPLADRGEPRRLVGYADVPAFLAYLEPAAGVPESASTWKLFLDDPAQFYLRRGIVPSILLILIGGFLLNLTPCVLPVIPINLAIIGASGTDSSRAARFGLGLVYGLGMALVYGALGLVVVLTGSVFGAINSSPVFNGAIAVLFFALALAMFDVWQLDFSRFRKTGGLAGRARLPAVLVMGGISALLAGACVAPVLIAVLALSGSLYAQGVGLALALPFLLGVGMALPWPLAAAGLAVLPKPGAWMETVKKIFGVLILLLALYYAWNAVAAFRTPAAPQIAADAPPTESVFRRFDFKTDAPEAFAALLAEAAASGQPVLIDFGAHWCKVCKLMDATTLRDPAVVAKLGDVFPIQILADEPNKPPAREALAPFAVQGYPTFLLYSKP